MTLAYTELEGSPTEDGNREQFTAVMELKCKWEDRRDMLGYFGNVYAMPIYPHLPDTGATVESLACQPLGNRIINNGGLASYESAQITVNWSNAMDSETTCMETIEPSGEFTSLNPNLFEWTSGENLIPDEAPSILLSSLLYTVEYPRRLNVPAGYLAGVGCCNASAVNALTLGLVFNAETLLYTPQRCSRIYTTEGAEAYSLGMSFAYKGSGWNTYWRPSTASWERLRFRGGGALYDSYKTYNFDNLR